MADPHIFSPEYYRRLAAIEERHPWSVHMQRLALELLRRHGAGAGRVLDAGCGAGFFTRLWGERCRIRTVVGVDASPDGLRLGRERGLWELAAGSVAALPFRDTVFDAVYCSDVLQHLDSRAAGETIAEFARVLRPGGVLLARTAARRGLGACRHRDTADYQQWDPQKLRAALEPRGFAIEWMSHVNWLPSLAADLQALGRPAPSGDVGLDAPAPRGLRRLLLRAYWLIEAAWLLGLGQRLPGGHTLLCVARKR